MDYTTISIPKKLSKLVKELLIDTGFNSVSSFVTYLLRQILAENKGTSLDKKMENKIKERLRNLGYIK
jgi:Arc/MetJ-type ribon-helix-helix transcriptional regulator